MKNHSLHLLLTHCVAHAGLSARITFMATPALVQHQMQVQVASSCRLLP